MSKSARDVIEYVARSYVSNEAFLTAARHFTDQVLGDLAYAGYVILPKEPSVEMKLAGARDLRDSGMQPNYTERSNGCYRAMLKTYEES